MKRWTYPSENLRPLWRFYSTVRMLRFLENSTARGALHSYVPLYRSMVSIINAKPKVPVDVEPEHVYYAIVETD